MTNKSYECIYGRLKVIQKLISKGNRTSSLSVGSKETRFAEINVDVDPTVHPDIVADARFLPFRNGCFSTVLFTDVIEHFPRGDEDKVLKEIFRGLCDRGELILSTPNNGVLYTFLDPARYVITHRHYEKEKLQGLLESHGFYIVSIFTARGFWAFLGNLWYCFITFPVKKILHYPLSYVPSYMKSRIDGEYERSGQNGYTIFVRATKIE